MRISLLLILLFSFPIHASPPPCTVWQIKVRTHPVKKYKREDGTEYSKTTREEHCRDKFPTITHWQDRFLNTAPVGWPEYGEKFKDWSQSEKEIVMQALSVQPLALRTLNAQIIRGVRSNHPKNPGSSVKIFNTISLYDAFFNSTDKSRILSHELTHLFLHELDREKLGELLIEMGWRDPGNGRLVRRKEVPLLKSDSDLDFTEDVANHIEDYLHERPKLCDKFPRRCQLIQVLVGPDFILEKK